MNYCDKIILFPSAFLSSLCVSAPVCACVTTPS